MDPPLRTIKLADDDGHPWGVDGDARGGITLDVHHDKVHDGRAYVASVNQSGVAASGAVLFMDLPDSTVKFHTAFTVFGDDAGVIEIFENITTLSGVTGGVPAYNQNRVSTNSSTVQFYSAPQYTSGSGTLIWNGRLGTSNPKITAGGDVSNQYEWIFQSGNVLVKYVPSGTGKVTSIKAYYYEVNGS